MSAPVRQPRASAGAAPCAALLSALLALAACDAPSVPARTGVYPFTLQTATGSLVMRWPAGERVRVAVAPGGSAAPNLSSALDFGAAQWNAAALYGEYEIVHVAAVADADVVIVGSDAPLPVDVGGCPPGGSGFGLTTFCLAPGGRSLATFPLAPGGGGHVRMLVTVLASFASDPAAAHRVVTHELGHVLGIARHSPNPADLMAAAAPVDRPQPADRATVLALYHTPADVLP